MRAGASTGAGADAAAGTDADTDTDADAGTAAGVAAGAGADADIASFGATMRALKIFVGGTVGLFVLLLVIGAFLPKDYRVERSIEIDASPEVVFDQVNSLRSWDAWSPWIARDPTIENTFSGPESGVGATVSWTSENSGEGTQTITLSERPRRIETRLDFGDMGQPGADWTFEPSGAGVRVTWGLSGTAGGPLGGYFSKMMDRWVGRDYEDGLAGLKKVVEQVEPD